MHSKKIIPYLLATAVILLLLIVGLWAYNSQRSDVPEGRLGNMSTSPEQEQDRNIDAMIIATLEDELEDLRKRTLELEEENRQLKGNGASRNILSQNKDFLQEKEQKQPARQEEPVVAQKEDEPARRTPEPEPVIEENKGELTKKAQPKAAPETNKKEVVSTSAAPPEEDNMLLLTRKIEKHLNKIADPGISEKERAAWKQETMAQFAEGGVRIVDETAGAPRQYSTIIFLNLLYKVPHTIEVKEVKSNQNNKITELRLTMQSKM